MSQEEMLFAIIFRLDSLISVLLSKGLITEQELKDAWDLILTTIEVETESEIEEQS